MMNGRDVVDFVKPENSACESDFSLHNIKVKCDVIEPLPYCPDKRVACPTPPERCFCENLGLIEDKKSQNNGPNPVSNPLWVTEFENTGHGVFAMEDSDVENNLTCENLANKYIKKRLDCVKSIVQLPCYKIPGENPVPCDPQPPVCSCHAANNGNAVSQPSWVSEIQSTGQTVFPMSKAESAYEMTCESIVGEYVKSEVACTQDVYGLECIQDITCMCAPGQKCECPEPEPCEVPPPVCACYIVPPSPPARPGPTPRPKSTTEAPKTISRDIKSRAPKPSDFRPTRVDKKPRICQAAYKQNPCGLVKSCSIARNKFLGLCQETCYKITQENFYNNNLKNNCDYLLESKTVNGIFNICNKKNGRCGFLN